MARESKRQGKIRGRESFSDLVRQSVIPSGRKTGLVRLFRLNTKGPIQVYLNRAFEVGNDLLSRVAVSSEAETLLLSSGWDQVCPST